MARVRTQNEIISSLLDFFRISQPKLDTKPGSVARDLVVEGFSAQLARLYDELGRVATLQSLRLALGVDLDRLGSNFGAKRLQGSKASGLALLTFNSLDSDIAINKGDTITARNGATFVVSDSTVVSSVFANQYKSVAAKYKSDLDFIGITDTYAIEISVEASSSGTQGNISKYSLNNTGISGINNVTNISSFGGGRAAEDDASFRTRILSIFSGANTGTALGYKNAVLADPAVIDAVVIEPGDDLMTRDGTQVSVSENGTRTIISEGTGGKVDVITFGVRLQEVIDSFIYRDKSNTGDPTNSKNDFVLGQISGDENKTVTRKRLDNLATGVLPNQPVNNIVQISGSVSGANFVEKSVDSLGRISGNYEIVRDTGAYGGSPWGFDRLHWISNKISDLVEDKTKLVFNGQDTLGFPDVLEISGVTQNITITNENSRVSSSNRASVQLSHFPVTNVTRVFNVTTGEKYTVSNQNPDGTGSTNPTGRIIISGKSLPATSDTLQVDYTWIFSYDPYFDFDNRINNNNPRLVQDSIDWGFSNAVRRELATLINSGSVLTLTTTHPISSVVDVNVFQSESTNVSLISGRLAVTVDLTVTNVISVTRADGAELWKTNKEDGTFSGLTIFLPTDSIAIIGDEVTVTYNAADVYNTSNPGSFSGNTITIVPSTTATAGTLVECNYIANVNTLLPATLLPVLPAIRSGNGFNLGGSTVIGTQPTTHIYSSGNMVLKNLRQAPANLALTIAGSISPGVITVSGTTLTGVYNAIFTVATSGLKQDISSAIKSALKLSSNSSIPSNIRLARVVSVEKVTTNTSLDVLSVDATYDLKGYRMYDNTFVKSESLSDSTLGVNEFVLPSTTNNLENVPSSGSRLRISFYYTTTTDTENVSFSKGGTLYTNKKFAIIDSVAISSGFNSASSNSANLTISNLNQPVSRSRYKVTYDYLAPKTNERITIRYNYDRLITDATLALETTRPINADVLAKAAQPVLVDVTMKIGVTSEFINNTNIVLQNVQDAVTAALNVSELNTKVDASDLVARAYTVNGVDSARIIFFNKSDKAGTVLSISAQKNEYIRANVVTIELET